MTSRLSIGAASALAAFGFAAFVPNAQAQAPDFNMGWTVNGVDTVYYNWEQFGTLNGFVHDLPIPQSERTWTGWSYTGDLVGLGWDLEWNCVFNASSGGGGAFVTANIVVTNNDIIDQNFSLLMTMPTGFLGDLNERGSIVGTVTDLTFDDATVSAPVDGQIYTPMIDGVDEVPGFLMEDPFAESAGGPLFSNTVGPADFGIPVPVLTSQPIDDSIGILLDFVLTSGDSASFTAIFEVIPAPAGLPILAALGLVAGRRRRRR